MEKSQIKRYLKTQVAPVWGEHEAVIHENQNLRLVRYTKKEPRGPNIERFFLEDKRGNKLKTFSNASHGFMLDFMQNLDERISIEGAVYGRQSHPDPASSQNRASATIQDTSEMTELQRKIKEQELSIESQFAAIQADLELKEKDYTESLQRDKLVKAQQSLDNAKKTLSSL